MRKYQVTWIMLKRFAVRKGIQLIQSLKGFLFVIGIIDGWSWYTHNWWYRSSSSMRPSAIGPSAITLIADIWHEIHFFSEKKIAHTFKCGMYIRIKSKKERKIKIGENNKLGKKIKVWLLHIFLPHLAIPLYHDAAVIQVILRLPKRVSIGYTYQDFILLWK